tara:strand:- start:14675 stop:15766 length:1092 start_codon:yes stop_codon:yes gene_type:complete
MKILYDHQIFYIQKFGGISNYFYNLINNLKNNKENNIEVFAPLYINNYIDSLPKHIVKGFKINLNKLKLNYYVNNYLFDFKKKNFQPDIIHFTYYKIRNQKNKNSKYILTVYDMVHEQYPHYFYKDDTTKEKKQACEYVDHIICISNNTKKNLMERFNLPNEKISVVHLGADHLENIPDIEAVIKKNYILYVGSRQGYKNFDNFIKSYSINKNVNELFDVVVFGGERVKKNTLVEIKKLGIDLKKIHFLNGDEIILKNLYKNASLLVYPSFEEGFGIPPLEAMSQYCPVAASDINIFREIFNDACLYFNPNSIDDISLKIEKILNDKTMTDELVNSGIKRKNFFTWRQCAEKTIKIYEKVLNS